MSEAFDVVGPQPAYDHPVILTSVREAFGQDPYASAGVAAVREGKSIDEVLAERASPLPAPVATPRHFPARPDYFEFDASVAAIFDDMAVRSIPGYRHYFDRVTEIVNDRGLPKWTQVWDMGVSTGAGLAAVKRGTFSPYVEYFGVDISDPMLERASMRAPFATMLNRDLNRGLPAEVAAGEVGCFLYSWTLQFLASIEVRKELLAASAKALHPDGVIFVGEKFQNSDDAMHAILQDSYIHWRLENGYTIAEIKAKTRALAGSMEPWTHEELVSTAEKCGLRARPVYRQFNFGGYVLTRI